MNSLQQRTLSPVLPEPPRAGATKFIQGKITQDGKELNLWHVMDWYGSHLQTMGENIPRKYQPILEILIKDKDETINLETFEEESDPPDALVKFLHERDQAIRPIWGFYDSKGEWRSRPYEGKLSVDQPGVLVNWNLEKYTKLSADTLDSKFVKLAHVAFKSSYFHNQEVKTTFGSNPGEFGYGFYTVTGHDTNAATTISEVWSTEKKVPNDVVKFNIPKESLSKLVGKDDELTTFLIYVLQHSSGYPSGMSKEKAIDIMERINSQGKILIFPDDKDTEIIIESGKEKTSWSNYTKSNAGPSDHFLVVGPQRPEKLTGIRQVTFRGSMGQLILNSVPRQLETITGEGPK